MLQRGDRICQEKEHNRDNTLALNYVAVSGDFNLSRCSTDKALSGWVQDGQDLIQVYDNENPCEFDLNPITIPLNEN
jgi:hypothetical protein